METPEVVQLILQAAAMGQGGEVFVLDMGEPVRIADLAHDLIRLSGLEPGVDIEIEYTGVRPGEKLFEELVYDDETIYPTSHAKVMALNGQLVEPLAVERTLRRLEQLLATGPDGAAASSTATVADAKRGARSARSAVLDGSATAAGVQAWTAELVDVLYQAVGGRPVEVPAAPVGSAPAGFPVGSPQTSVGADADSTIVNPVLADSTVADVAVTEAAAAAETPDAGVPNG